jgi:WD40 repeat protein
MIRNSIAIAVMAFLPISVAAYAQTATPTGEIAFTNYHEETNRIYLMNADGSDSRLLTDGEHDAFLPLWSPDGKKIVYFENTTEQPLSERHPLRLMMMNADGSDPVEIAVEPENGFIMYPAWYLDWSPDSEHLVYSLFTEGIDARIQHFVVEVESVHTEMVGEVALAAVFSYARFLGNVQLLIPRPDGLYLTALDGSEPSLLSRALGWAFAVSPDNKIIAFIRSGSLMAFDLAASAESTLLETIPGRAEDQEVSRSGFLRWSPDGEYLSGMIELRSVLIPAVPEQTPLDAEDVTAVFTVRSDGSGYTIIDAADYTLTWSPDSQWIAYNVLDADGGYQIAVANPDGTGEIVVTSEGDNSQPAWRPRPS